MRIAVLLLFVLCLIFISCQKKQNPYELNRPESVIWNPATHTYLISNAGSGYILALQDKFKFIVFNKAKLQSPKGMAILGNNLFVSDINRLVGFDLVTGEQTFELAIPASEFLNDVTADMDKMVYVSDSQKSMIAMVDTDSKTTRYFRHSKLANPNGLYHLRENEAEFLYIVSLRDNAPVQRLDLKTEELISFAGTEISRADGLTRDKSGHWLVSSWADSTIYRFSPDFQVRSQLREKYTSPADIFYSIINDELVIPLMQSNLLQFVNIADTTIISDK